MTSSWVRGLGASRRGDETSSRLYGFTSSIAEKHKTTLTMDAEAWRAFRDEVTRRVGPRAVSVEIDKLLRGLHPEVFERALPRVFPRPEGGLPSLEEEERARPRVRGGVADLIREARDEREDRVLGPERPG